MANPEAPSRRGIKEANDHIKRLYDRIKELEETVKEQAGVLLRKDELYKERLKDFSEQRMSMEQTVEIQSSKLQDLKEDLFSAESRVKQLGEMCREKDRVILRLEERCSIVDEAISYMPVLENLVALLRNAEYIHTGGVPGNACNSIKPIQRVPAVDGPAADDQSCGSSSRRSSSQHQHQQQHARSTPVTNLTRSFNITQNFSASSDEGEDSHDHNHL